MSKTSTNTAAVPEAKGADGYNGNLTSKQNGSVGGYMVKKMIEAQEKQMSQGSGYTGGSMQ